MPALIQDASPSAAQIALLVLRLAVAAFFVFVGIKNLAGDPTMAQDFQRWGYPEGFRLFTACLQIAAGLALVLPATAFAGAVLLCGVMIGAVATHLWFDPPATAVPAIVFLLLVGILLGASRPALLRG